MLIDLLCVPCALFQVPCLIENFAFLGTARKYEKAPLLQVHTLFLPLHLQVFLPIILLWLLLSLLLVVFPLLVHLLPVLLFVRFAGRLAVTTKVLIGK